MRTGGWLLLLFLFGCGPREETSKPPTEPVPLEAAAVSTEGGTLRGNIFFEGVVPLQTELQMEGNPECRAQHPPGKILGGDVLVQEGKVQNVFVYVKEGLEGRTFAPPEAPVGVDNVKCLYEPHVAGVQVNQPIELRNSDPTLHNVHALPQKQSEWNVGLPIPGMKVVKKFSEAEVMVRLKCDVHPWMAGYLGVLPHPYFSVTGADGRFEIKNLPPGIYTVEAWHERFGTQTERAELLPGEVKEIELTFRAA